VRHHWRARGFAAAILQSDGSISLCTDLSVSDTQVHASDIVTGSDVVSAVADKTAALGLASARIGIVGSDAMTCDHYQALVHSLPDADLVSAAETIDDLMMIKSAYELRMLRAAAAVGDSAMEAMMDFAEVGRSVAQVVSVGVSRVVAAGGEVANVFSAASSIIHPTDPGRNHVLQEGDLLSLDMSGVIDGYYFDFSRSRVIGGSQIDRQLRLIKVARDVVHAVIRSLEPGNTVAAAVRSGFEVLEAAGYESGEADFAALGHGLGMGFEKPWLLPDNDLTIEPSMCIAVEMGVTDGFLYASHEEDVIVTDHHPEIITQAPWYGVGG
jgi:Xaa-Pro aminopeptidase